MKKLFSVVSTLTFLVGLLAIGLVVNSDKAFAYAGGDGSPGDPFQIVDCSDLQNINDNKTAAYILNNDVDCSATTSWNGGLGFFPIGTDGSRFEGKLDGNGHVIQNLSMIRTSFSGGGMISYLGASGDIYDLGMTNASLNIQMGGVMVGHNFGSISSVYTQGSITTSASNHNGGIAGSMRVGGTISDAYTNVTITAGSGGTGGIVGFNWGGTVNRAYVIGPISATGGTPGAIQGQTTGGQVYNSFYNTDTIAIIGGGGTGKTTSQLKNITTFTDTETSGLDDAWDFQGTENDDAGTDDVWRIHPDYNNGYPFFGWEPFVAPVEYEEGTGVDGDPYMITDCEHLQGMRQDLDAHYRLDGPIDCTMTNPSDPDFEESGTWGDELGFEPVGNYDEPFTGSLTGASQGIDGLYINRADTDYVGLFGVFSGDEVSDFILDNINITGRDVVGAVAGSMTSIEENQVNLNSISVFGDLVGDESVGGIAGEASGIVVIDSVASFVDVSGAYGVGGVAGRTSSATLTGSYSEGDIIALGDEPGDIGGFVGYAGCASYLDANQTQSDVIATDGASSTGGFAGADGCQGPGSIFIHNTASGNVSGDESVGGFIGQSSASIVEESSATGTVTGNDEVGGFAGSIWGYQDEEDYYGQFIRSYADNTVNGGSASGGFAGMVQGGIFENNYAKGLVNASSAPGGFIGTVDNDWEEYFPTIINSYAANEVVAGVYPKGFIGLDTGGIAEITNSFYDQDISNSESSPYGTPKSTAQMKSADTFTTELGGADAWDFNEVWSTDTEANDGYPCLQWAHPEEDEEDPDVCAPYEFSDGDFDGAPDSEEDGAPNDGDANDDGTADSQQANVLSYMNPVTNEWATLETSCQAISNFQVGSEAGGADADTSYTYPMGLSSFWLTCEEEGETATVKQYYHYNEGDDDYVARKWKSDGTYVTIPGFDIYGLLVGDSPTFVTEFELTDGSDLDDDGDEDGVIRDPSGPALLATTTDVGSEDGDSSGVDLSTTGQNTILVSLIAIVLIMLPIAWMARKQATQK